MTAVLRYRATLAYDGTNYQGFQRQAEGTPSIQAEVEKAIEAVTGQAVSILAAGRTDTGVHAVGQVIAFDVEWTRGAPVLLRAINAVLPDDIALQDLRQASADFHPRYDAVSRLYKYLIVRADQRQPLLRHRAWHVRAKLDEDAMDAAAMMLLGEHDFATFGQPPFGENTVRLVMESHWLRRRAPYGTDWTYVIEANAFLKHMVRRIVGTLVDVGRGAMTLDAFERAFRAADLSQAGTLAPPQGLTLEQVNYPEGA